MSTALVLGAQLDPPSGPISASKPIRGQHSSMPAPAPSASSASQSHWSQPAVSGPQHHSSYSAYSGSQGSHGSMYGSNSNPYGSHHVSSYSNNHYSSTSNAGQSQSHLSYASYAGTHNHPSAGESPSAVSNGVRNGLGGGNGGGGGAAAAGSPTHSPHVPTTSSASMSSSAHSTAATSGGGLNIAGMLNQPVTTSSAGNYASKYGNSSAQPSMVSHAEHSSGYFASAPNGSMNGHIVSPTIPSTSGAGSSGSMPAYSSASYMHSGSHASSHSLSGVPVSAPTSTYSPHGSYMPSQAPHPGLHTPGLSTGVSGMGISPSTGLGVPVYTQLPMQNRHRVTTTLWEDEGTLCFQVDAKGVCIARRNDNNMINGTKLLNVCGMTRGKRDGILKNEKDRIVVKVGAMHLKGVWITFERAKTLAEQNDILDILYPLFETNLQDFLYQPEFPRSGMGGLHGSQERSAQRPRVLGPTSTTSMSPPLSVPTTMSQAAGGIATTLSMAPYSAPISTYPSISSVTHPPLMRSQTTPAFAMPLPRQSPVMTSSPNGAWGQPPVSTAHQYSQYSISQSPSMGPISSSFYPSGYGQGGSSTSSAGGPGHDDDSFSSAGGGSGSLQRPAGVDRRHTDPVGDASKQDGYGGKHESSAYYPSRSSSNMTSPVLSGGGGRAPSGSVSSHNGAPAHLRRTSGLKRSHDATD
ncbi:hypothetical protein OC846_000396 [Tilletia horrida]|uniref:HTH APSES-type domain-containing protein n=1 Tax=Tilletia horrida TaxID=155126 RepID=A0AAN6GY17_9BASI|nr:hypothetical protein OC845_000015 [Tilletia horrida]KAK0557608.1 hypothetical protein OC846_000396 [Tilletia horrida]